MSDSRYLRQLLNRRRAMGSDACGGERQCIRGRHRVPQVSLTGTGPWSTIRRSTKLECTPVTPSMRVIRCSSSR